VDEVCDDSWLEKPKEQEMVGRSGVLSEVALGASFFVMIAMWSGDCSIIIAQMPTASSATAGRRLGTVKVVAGNGLTLTTDAGEQVVVSVRDGARILQLAPGSTDLKGAQQIALKDIAVGDRVLVSGTASNDASAFAATRVILMKSGDIAQKHLLEQADWQKRGTGGIVSAIDPNTGVLTVASGAKRITVNTSRSTQFQRYAGDSVKFEDAKPSTLAQIQIGDQLRVRGVKSADGQSIQAEEVVSGSFKNLAGLIATIDPAGGKLTLKDLTTKKTFVVAITENSSIRTLPAQAAIKFAARAKGGPSATGEAGTVAASQGGEGGVEATRRSAGADLSEFVSKLPNDQIGDLKAGAAVMIVASQPEPGSGVVTAVTVLLGVEPILAATPSGTPSMALSPWSVGATDSSAQ
jgi:Domain of unknown function (DUF5666)